MDWSGFPYTNPVGAYIAAKTVNRQHTIVVGIDKRPTNNITNRRAVLMTKFFSSNIPNEHDDATLIKSNNIITRTSHIFFNTVLIIGLITALLVILSNHRYYQRKRLAVKFEHGVYIQLESI